MDGLSRFGKTSSVVLKGCYENYVRIFVVSMNKLYYRNDTFF